MNLRPPTDNTGPKFKSSRITLIYFELEFGFGVPKKTHTVTRTKTGAYDKPIRSIAKANHLYVVTYYRPPDNDESVNGLEAALEDLQDITKNNPKSSIVVAGDFNAKDIQWDTLSTSPESNKETMCEIINTLNESHLHQLQCEPTVKDAVLDLFCTNKPGLVKSLETIPGIRPWRHHSGGHGT